jgi:predicted transcriptional regulator
MNVKEDLHRLVDQLADSELETARKVLERLHIDVDEDPVSREELVEIEEGSAQIDRGECVTIEEFKRKHGS